VDRLAVAMAPAVVAGRNDDLAQVRARVGKPTCVLISMPIR
jgi:hypothetical protein